jgi:IS30 family transposase
VEHILKMLDCLGIKTKGDAWRHLEEWFTLCPAMREHRSDNGSEFKGRFKEILTARDVKLYYTATYSAWQNGLAEVHNRIVVTGAKLLLASCELSPELWWDS